jgi:pilus assembly protein CpaB
MTTVTLLTPERHYPAGTPFSNIRMKEAYWPRVQVPEGAILDLAEVNGMTAKVALTPGVPLLREQVTEEYVEGRLLPSVGNRAVTIPVDDVTGIEAHAGPGSHVSVYLTFYRNREITTKVIVNDARVLSQNGIQERKGVRGVGVVNTHVRTVTRDVSPKDAIELQTAKKMGDLALALIRPGEKGTSSVTEHTEKQIGGSDPAEKESNRRCAKKGTLRIEGGGDFVIDCEGNPHRIGNVYEP